MLDVNNSWMSRKTFWVRVISRPCIKAREKIFVVRLFINIAINFDTMLRLLAEMRGVKIVTFLEKFQKKFFLLFFDLKADSPQKISLMRKRITSQFQKIDGGTDWKISDRGMDLFQRWVVLQFLQIESNLFCVWCDQREYRNALNEKSGGTSEVVLRELQK